MFQALKKKTSAIKYASLHERKKWFVACVVVTFFLIIGLWVVGGGFWNQRGAVANDSENREALSKFSEFKEIVGSLWGATKDQIEKETAILKGTSTQEE